MTSLDLHDYETLSASVSPAQGVFVFTLALTVWLVRRLAAQANGPSLWSLPGTLAHELSHFLMALLTGARPQEMSLWPTKVGNGQWIVGFVECRPNWFNGSLVALAPLLLLPSAAWGGALLLSAQPWYLAITPGVAFGFLLSQTVSGNQPAFLPVSRSRASPSAAAARRSAASTAVA